MPQLSRIPGNGSGNGVFFLKAWRRSERDFAAWFSDFFPTSLPLRPRPFITVPGMEKHKFRYQDIWLAPIQKGRYRLRTPFLVIVVACALSLALLSSRPQVEVTKKPASKLGEPWNGWKDDTWPIRQPAPWDISTNFPYPRKLEFDVTNSGTWLRLDVHPTSSEIVFDMLGDLYCLPADAISTKSPTDARPILRGIPHDSDPHFSPDGATLVFTSDAELGVQNIWTMPWSGCDNMDIRNENALAYSEEDHQDLVSRGTESSERKEARLFNEGRLLGI